MTTVPKTRTCANCDGPHAYRDCPDLPPLEAGPIFCGSCKKPTNPETAECSGCSD